MAEIVRNRVIRPSSRMKKSKNYKVDTSSVSAEDILVVTITHENKLFEESYRFAGSDVAHKDSISFRVRDDSGNIYISWSGAKPVMKTEKCNSRTEKVRESEKEKVKNSSELGYNKNSFSPISDSNSQILILGTMPGDKSIEVNEYYAHPRNRFWNVIAKITDSDLPLCYEGKKLLLTKFNIAIWDVANKMERKGSLDKNIKNEIPNDLDNFIRKHKRLKVIAFNGKKAESLFDKYFDRKMNIKYIALPSTSPANARLSYDKLCEKWSEIIE